MLQAFLNEGDLTFSSYSFDDRADSATKTIRVTLLAVLIPALTVPFAILAFMIYRFRHLLKRSQQVADT